jgi:integrase
VINSSDRHLAIPTVLLEALKEHKRIQAEHREILNWPKSDLVFVSTKGTPIEPRNINRHFKDKVLPAAGLPQTVRLHDLRHSCATFLVVQGVHPRVVQEYLGHSSIHITMETYAHVLPETHKDAAAKMNALFPRSDDAATKD